MWLVALTTTAVLFVMRRLKGRRPDDRGLDGRGLDGRARGETPEPEHRARPHPENEKT